MLVEPRPPHRAHAVSRLQQGPHPRAGATAHQAQVAAMPTRQELDNGRGFAMPPHPEHDALIGPFHGLRAYRIPPMTAAVRHLRTDILSSDNSWLFAPSNLATTTSE